MREVQRHERRLGGEDGVVEQGGRGLGVDEDVELGPLRVVAHAVDVADAAHDGGREAAADAAAHDAQARDVGPEVRVRGEQRGDVGQRARGHDPRRAGRAGPQRRRHGLDGGRRRGVEG